MKLRRNLLQDLNALIVPLITLPLQLKLWACKPFVARELFAQVKKRLCGHRHTRKQLRESGDIYRSLFDNTPYGLAYCRMLFKAGQPSDFIYLDVNPAFATLTGLNGVVGKRISEVIPGIRESNCELFERYGRVATGAGSERFETYVEPLGMWFAITVYSPKREHFVAVFDVITERKQADEALKSAYAELLHERNRLETVMQALRTSEERYRTLASATFEGIAVTKQGRLVDANLQLLSIFGYTREELIGRTVQELLPPEERERVMSNISAGLESCIEHDMIHKNGSRLRVEAHGKTIPDADCPVRLTAIRDITERKQIEANLEEKASRLRDADRRKDEFLAMLAHELRNPLAPIRNAVQILQHADADAAQISWCGEVIDRQVGHLVRLVDDLLDVSRINCGQIELRKAPLAVRDFVQLAVETSGPLIEARRHTLTVALPPEPLWVEGDLIRLAQVVSNLLNNAAKYTVEGGSISLAVEFSLGEVCIRVRDTGCGIDPSDLSKVFDLFYQADCKLDRSCGGLGIGLSLVSNLAAMHGGTALAFSAGPGLGSEFVVRLPRLALTEAAPACSGPVPPPLGGKLRILVVDDNCDAAESLAMLLGIDGYPVWMAHDGPTALDMAQAVGPELILLDIGLPGMDGYQVAQALRQRDGRLGQAWLIALTGYGQPEDREKALAAGFDEHLVKPVDTKALRKLLLKCQAAKRQKS